MAPTMIGRAAAGLCGLLIGCSVTYYMTKDYQLIKFTPAQPNSDGSLPPKKVKISFREMQPLELTPEARERREQFIREKKQEIEQIIQEPTT